MNSRFQVPGERTPDAVVVLTAALGLLSAVTATQLAQAALDEGAPSRRVAPMAEQRVDHAPAVPAPPPVTSAAPAVSAVVVPGAPSGASADRTVPAPAVSAECPPSIVRFAEASVTLPHAEEHPLATLAAWLSAHTDASVLVDGHADALGAEEENLRLSRLRALAVAAELEHGGLPRARLTVRGFGAYQPLPGVKESAAENRRVVVKVLGAPTCPPVAEVQ